MPNLQKKAYKQFELNKNKHCNNIVNENRAQLSSNQANKIEKLKEIIKTMKEEKEVRNPNFTTEIELIKANNLALKQEISAIKNKILSPTKITTISKNRSPGEYTSSNI